jgi:formate dehydrogenase major subunit
LAATFGRGAMTNGWNDIEQADVVMVMGSNPAENHPISFKYVNKAQEKGGKLVVIDPRFTRSASLADLYAPIRPGADIAFLNGIINYLLQNDKIQREYVVEYTNASYLIDPAFGFNDGIFSGYDAGKKEYNKATWKYQLDSKGIPKQDTTLQDPNCVYQLMKRHFSRYTPEKVSAISGCPVDTWRKVADVIASTHRPDKVMTIMYAMGTTQHTVGTQNIRCYSIIQMLLGNIGLAGGGIQALRGESNVQGSTDAGLLWHIIPGYNPAPLAKKHPNLKAYLEDTTPKTNDPKSINWWSNRPKYVVSMLKAWFGDAATKDNGFCYDWLPKAAKPTPYIVVFEDMYAGKHKGAILMGTNPLVGGPNADRSAKALAKLDWLVCADLWETDTSVFWKQPGANSRAIQTEVFLLPMASSVEKEGSVSNSGRWAQWRYKAVNPPGVAQSDLWFVDKLYQKLKALYQLDVKNGRPCALPDPILKANWNYTHAGEEEPDAHAVAKEINGYTWGNKKLLENFTKLKDDGTTACGNWIYSGSYNEDGNNMTRRNSRDVGGKVGLYPGWAWSWPMNRRIIYNRASVKRNGEPWYPAKWVVKWTGSAWKGDVVDGGGTAGPAAKNPFIMNPEGVGKLFTQGLAEGPFPEHYEPTESPTRNIMSSREVNPAVKILDSLRGDFGTVAQFPYVGTSYRVTEHWQAGAMTRNLPWLTELVPSMFCEISPTLAAQKGIRNGDTVKVSSKRGTIDARALVTTRLQTMKVNGRDVEMVGLIWHFGHGCAATGDSCNMLTPSVGDANTNIPEFKAFLVNIRKA